MSTESSESTESATTPVHRHHKLHRHTFVQRIIVVVSSVLAVASIAGSLAVWYATNTLQKVNRVATVSRPAFDPSVSLTPRTTIVDGAVLTVAPDDSTPGDPNNTGSAASPVGTFGPPVDVGALNFLLTGTDNNACIDPTSKYYGGTVGRDNLGSRSDAILILRVDPHTSQAAILSFPRDLWVTIGNHQGRINSAWDVKNVQKLIDTIHTNFGVSIDHWVNVDFCAFQSLVDVVGGIKVPFAYPARDTNTGFEFDGTGCHPMQGDEALAYVRSRHYQYLDPATSTWKTDPSSDYGRITRQQDFIKRVLQKAIDKGATNPVVANNLINAIIQKVIVDQGLTVQELLDVAGAMRSFDPAKVRQYQIAGVGFFAGTAAVIRPTINTPNMKAILAVFRGQAKLADAPVQVLDTSPGSALIPTVAPPTTLPTLATQPPKTTVKTAPAPPTVPVVTAADVQKGIYPDATNRCT
jgi:LCP family protein required for cell wall assembly